MTSPQPDASPSFLSLYGDSLSLPRKGVVRHDQRYVSLILQRLHAQGLGPLTLLDRGEGACTVSMMLQKVRHDRHYFDGHSFSIALIQSGIVDCAPRPIKEETRDRISRLPNFIRRRVVRYLHKNRTRMLMKRAYVRTELPKFEADYQTMVDILQETHSHVFCINICPATDAYEQKAPNIKKQVAAYNAVIERIVQAKASPKIHLVDLHAMVSAKPQVYDYIVQEDDHHITSLTHELIADTVLKKLNL